MQAAPALSPNFGFLGQYDAALVMVAARAEQYFPDDPVTALMKLRQFGELLAQQLAARTGVYGTVEEPQAELLARLRRENAIPREAVDLFHDLRRAGNEATHGHVGDLSRPWRGGSDPVWELRKAAGLFEWSSGKFLPKKAQVPGEFPVYGGNGVNGFHSESITQTPSLIIGRVGAHCGNVHVAEMPAWITDNAIYAKK